MSASESPPTESARASAPVSVCAQSPCSPARPRPATIQHRADFLAANRGRRIATPGFILLVHRRSANSMIAADAMRIGYTVTKKIGGAVVRNRMKRRFRALAADILPEHGLAGHDHVLIGRNSGIERDFSALHADFLRALADLKRGKGDHRGPHHRSVSKKSRPARREPAKTGG